MAVLVEALSAVARRDAIDERYEGGWDGFVSDVPNGTLCTDEVIVRVGFMHPADAEPYAVLLQRRGLRFLMNGTAIDFATLDQQRGIVSPCDWLEFARIPMDDSGGSIAVCWFFDEPRTAGPGLYMKCDPSMPVATPPDWEFEGSLSQQFKYTPPDEMEKKLRFLRHEDGHDIFLDLDTGEERYVGRTK